MTTTMTGPASVAGSSVEVTDDAIIIRVPRPEGEAGSRDERAALAAFAARADGFAGLIRWYQFEAVNRLRRMTVAAADEVSADGQAADVFTRVYDPICQTATLYAQAAGARQHTAERFVENAERCIDEAPMLGRLMRDGVLTPYFFDGVLAQVALVDDVDVLAAIDAEAALRLQEAGKLSRAIVESIVAAVVAEFDPDAARRTRAAARASKRVAVNPVNEALSEFVVTADAADVAVSKKVVDAIISGVCSNDPRTKNERRSDAAIARINGTPFVCECGRDDCAAELDEQSVAARCKRVVLHVVVRGETLSGQSDLPAYLDGFGPISAPHARELAQRSDAVVRDLDLGDLLGGMAQAGNPYRPTAAADAAIRALHGQCSWVGCDRPAYESDLDHVVEFDHSDPCAGGPTCACNLAPKCEFHHGLKTHVPGWVDELIVDANGVFWVEITSPDGMTTRSRAMNSWLLPELGLIPCTHGPIVESPTIEFGAGPDRPYSRTRAKHRYRMRVRAANRRAREAEQARVAASAHDWGEPPF
ncbi:DUF222 domain-containing protein [Gordonia liuliyuniae]|uniref:13E12 repeat family protein n=1 Tax=Gordonia liuliyuniae TaxID=2911517 RepID=A0ABS9IRK7_9ACTN|nr:DUF222 domain-containing protein [Gordonia liuliyuniae]MCF8588195.1 13E12 repeat family protein [Gordonia liuliyuniae]